VALERRPIKLAASGLTQEQIEALNYASIEVVDALPATPEQNTLYVDRDDDSGGVTAGTTAGTFAAGNDSRIVNALKDGEFAVTLTKHGAKPDAVIRTDGAITSGQTTLTCAGASFTSADVGKLILIAGASSSDGAAHKATITARVSATQVTISSAATATVTGAKVVYGTDNHDAIIAAWTEARSLGKQLAFVSLQPYLTSHLEMAGAGTTINGYGSKLLIATRPSDNKNAFYVYGDDIDIRNLHVEAAITYDIPQAGFQNYEIARLGGKTGGPYAKRLRLRDCTFIGGSGCNVINTETVLIDGCRVYQSHGNSLGAVNCKGDVTITNNYCENGNDDLIAVTADAGTGQSTTRVTVANNNGRNGDAGGIKIAGADYVSITGNNFQNTYTATIHVIQDTVYNLQASNRVVIANNTVKDGGQRYGAGLYHTTMSTAANGIRINSNAADCVISSNVVLNSANRAIAVQNANQGLSIIGNRINGAGSAGIDIGDLNDTTFSTIVDLVVLGNDIRNTQHGIAVGGAINFDISHNRIRSYRSGAAGSYRGIQYNYLKNGQITGNVLYNDDSGSNTVFEMTSGSSVNVREWGNLRLGSTTQVEGGNAFSIGLSRIAFGGAAPATGSWSVGDRVYNTTPTTGGPEGWVCTAAGTPGTFEQFGQVGTISGSVTGVIKQRTATGTYIPTTGGGTSSFTPANNRLYVSPIVLQAAATGTTLVANVNTAGEAGSTLRLGLYADTGGPYPGALIVDAGTVSVASSGAKTITISQSLPAGVYWLAGVIQNAPTTPPVMSGIGGNVPGVAATSTALSNNSAGYNSDSQSGALPGTFPASQGSTGTVIKMALGI
jgi:hypothetical protein